MNDSIISTSSDVWRVLLTKGGLDLKHYDLAIVDKMCEELNIPLLNGKNDFEQELNLNKVQVEDLIFAFFKATAPFSTMMSDLLLQFEKSGAIKTKDNLKVRFDFDSKKDHLEFDLEHFRKWYIQLIHATRPIEVYEINSDILFGIYSDIVICLDHDVREGDTRNIEVLNWVEHYERGVLKNDLQPFALLGDREFDLAFLKLYKLWDQVLNSCILHSINSALKAEWGQQEKGEVLTLQRLERDNWLRQFILILEALHREVAEGKRDELSSNVTQRINERFESIPHTSRVVTELINELVSLLDLPIWNKRYDLYAAWISTQIIIAMNDPDIKYIHENGTINFSFARYHLASSRKRIPTLQLWSELRTSLVNPRGKKRKKSIQPDYSLLTEVTDAERSTILVIECKQYLIANAKNFSDALNDYANGRENANVVIVNYGKGNSQILSKVDAGLQSRVKVINDMRPFSDAAIQEFHKYIQDTIDQVCIKSEPEITTLELTEIEDFFNLLPLKIELTWSEIPRDLDLQLSIELLGEDMYQEVIDYTNKGNGTENPWAQLLSDVTNGYGPEEININKWMPGIYRLGVRNFSKVPFLNQSDAKINLYFNGQKSIELHCPTEGIGEFWDILSYNSETEELIIFNCLTDITK